MAGRVPGPVGATYSALIDEGTSCLHEGDAPGPICATRVAPQRDELTPIAQYIASEMNLNAAGPDATKLRELNTFSALDCIADFSQLPLWKQLLGLGIAPQQCIDMEMSYHSAALLLWTQKVRQNGDWDHKPLVAAKFHPRQPHGHQYWHLYGNTEYYYDFWSNLHYGYVGKAAGFSESTLLDGAGLEQIGSTFLRGKWPQRAPDVSGLRAWDDPSDRAAISAGIRLRQRSASAVSAREVLNIILSSPSVDTRPLGP